MGVNLRENTTVDALSSTNIKITSPMATGVNNGSKINKENGEEHYHHEEDKVNRKVSFINWYSDLPYYWYMYSSLPCYYWYMYSDLPYYWYMHSSLPCYYCYMHSSLPCYYWYMYSSLPCYYWYMYSSLSC